MRVLQILLPDASHYDRKCQRIDFHALSATGRHRVELVETPPLASLESDVAHLYGTPSLSVARAISIPWIAAAKTSGKRRWFRNPPQPARVATPLDLPEAVEEHFFNHGAGPSAPSRTVGVLAAGRTEVRNAIEQTQVRIERFRNDVRWRVFEEPPSPEQVAAIDVWIDPAVSETDYDGYVAEAMVAGAVTIATRTEVNVHRMEKSRTGFLVPINDPNEMTHAILTALFKPEVAWQKKEAARQTVAKFRAHRRVRVLERLYESMTS